MVEIVSKSGGLTFFTDLSDLSPARRAAFEEMHAEMEADREAEEDDARTAS